MAFGPPGASLAWPREREESKAIRAAIKWGAVFKTPVLPEWAWVAVPSMGRVAGLIFLACCSWSPSNTLAGSLFFGLARILHERAVAGGLIGHPMVSMFSMRHWTVFCPIRAPAGLFRHTSPYPHCLSTCRGSTA